MKLKLPRVVALRFPFGFPLGRDEKQQRQIIRDALDALGTITEPGTIMLWFCVAALTVLAGTQFVIRYQDSRSQSQERMILGEDGSMAGPTLWELALQDKCRGTNVFPAGRALQSQIGGMRYTLVTTNLYNAPESRFAAPIAMVDVVLIVRNEAFSPI